MVGQRTLAIALSAQLWAVQDASAQSRYLDGALVNRGVALHIRLAVDPGVDSTALLDIPELWYAEEPVPLVRGPDAGFSVTFPFGIGEIEFSPLGQGFQGTSGSVHAFLDQSEAPPYEKIDLTFGAYSPHMPATLYLPRGDDPVPAVILVGGSGAGGRSEWSYRSKADYYARMGIAALVYDRRDYASMLEDGRNPDFWTHAEDLAAARDLLASQERIEPDAIGLQGGSQGVWLSIIAQAEHGGFAFMVLTGAPAVTPSQQQLQLVLQGMRDDDVDDVEIAHAMAYQRLYFAVAHRWAGWDELAAARDEGVGTVWGSYLDQPRSLDDLKWWRKHMDYDPRRDLLGIGIPMLIMSGGRDWVTPPAMNLPLFRQYADQAGNASVVIKTIHGADHRLELSPGTSPSGQWHWFQIAPEVREEIPRFLREKVGLHFGANTP